MAIAIIARRKIKAHTSVEAFINTKLSQVWMLYAMAIQVSRKTHCYHI